MRRAYLPLCRRNPLRSKSSTRRFILLIDFFLQRNLAAIIGLESAVANLPTLVLQALYFFREGKHFLEPGSARPWTRMRREATAPCSSAGRRLSCTALTAEGR